MGRPDRTGAGILIGSLLLFGPTPGHAQSSEPSTIQALRLSGGLRIDGRLDEPAWGQAVRITNFTQRELDEGAPASERTEVAVLYDDSSLFIGFWGYDREPSNIVANRMQRDFSWSSEDNFEVILDTYSDHRTGYLFVTNPNGAKADALVTDNGRRSNSDWDGVWEVRTSLTGEGWFAEIRIPFSTLKFPTAEKQSWGINFERNIRRKREQVLWQGWSRNYNLEQVSQAGRLVGIQGANSGNLLDVRPHAIAGMDRSGPGTRETVTDIGFSASYLVTPTVKLNAAWNPDFAQVESDREEVNLSRFSITYPEKREFFLEGQEFFEFEMGGTIRPFYSRRIGIAPDRSEIPILGGLRLLGRERGTTVGGLIMRTKTSGAIPSTDYAVVRVRQDLFEESSAGVLLTSRSASGGTDLTWGADLRLSTSTLLGDRNLEAGGAAAATTDGSAQRLFFNLPNDLVEFSSSWERADSTFNPQVGFMRRSGYRKYHAELVFGPRPTFLPWIQQLEFMPFDLNYYTDDGSSEMQSLNVEVRPLGFTTRSGESMEVNLRRQAERLTEDFEILEGSVIPTGTYWYTRYAVEGSTFGGRSVSGAFDISLGEFYLGRRTEWEFSGSWRTGRFLSLSGDYTQNQITFGGDRLTVEEVGGRADFAFSPVLFGAVGVQWNSEEDEAILNLRVNWIPSLGSDLYLVVNQEADTAGAAWSPRRTVLLSKIVWRIAL